MANIEDLRDRSVSSGTLKSEDLIPKFLGVLKTYGKDKYDAYIKENPEVLEWKDLDDETQAWVVDELIGLLNDIAPEDCYFGANEGDGADFGFWSMSNESKKKESLYGRPDSEKDELAGKYYVDIENDSEGTIYSSKQEFNDYASAEEWANSELEKNADDEDVFQASIYKMFVDTDTEQLDSDLEGTILKSDVCESKKSEADGNKDIFTLDLTRIYADGDEVGLDDMQAAQNFYDEDEAIQAAKDLVDSYKDDDDVVQVTVMAGEQEKPNGDIVGDSFDIFTASSSDSATTAKYREKAGYTKTEGLDYYAKGGKSEAKKSEGLPPKKLGNRLYRSRADLINKMKTLDAVEITTPAQFNDIHSKQWLHTAGYAMDINGNLVGQTYFGDKDGKWYYATTKTFQGDYLPECKEEAKKSEKATVICSICGNPTDDPIWGEGNRAFCKDCYGDGDDFKHGKTKFVVGMMISLDGVKQYIRELKPRTFVGQSVDTGKEFSLPISSLNRASILYDPRNESKKSESLTLKQKELKDMARFGQAEDITTISDAEAKELKKKGIETVGISRGTYGMNGALLRDSEGNKYVITARSSNLFYFV